MSEHLPKHYNLLDLVRVYCACLVIFIHMGLPASASLVPCLAGQSVPFFFLVSGFFFEKRASKATNVLSFALKYAGTILLIYAVWALFWTPYIVKEAIAAHGDRSALYVILVVFRRIWLAGVAPYWYLLVLAEAVLLLAFMMRFNAYRLGLVFCVLGLVLRFVYSMQPSGGIGAVICKVFYTVFSWNCNVVMTGFPLMFLGYTFSRNGKLLRHMRRTVIGILYLISVLAAFLVYGFSYSHYGIPFWLIESILLFLFCILPAEYEARLPAPLCRAARNLSSVIYLTHTALLSLFGYVFHIWDTAIRFVLCVAVSILLTYFIKKLNWSPLSKLMMVK